MRKERIDLRSFLMPFPGYHSQLNSSLTGIDIRLNTTSNQPEWSARGAGSWSPFSGAIKGFVAVNFEENSSGYTTIYLKEDGSFEHSDDVNAMNASGVFQFVQTRLVGQARYIDYKVLKDGYYSLLFRGGPAFKPRFLNAGDVISGNYGYGLDFYITGLVYYGNIDPMP